MKMQSNSELKLNSAEKLAVRKLMEIFRKWYASLSIKELSTNLQLVRQIEEFERALHSALI